MALIIRFAQASKPIKTFINQAHHLISLLKSLKAKFKSFPSALKTSLYPTLKSIKKFVVCR